MRAPNTVHKWLLSLILLIGCLSVSAKEKRVYIIPQFCQCRRSMDSRFPNELQKRFPYEGNIELHEYFLAVPVLTNAEEVKQAQDNLLQTFPTPPKVIIIVGDPGWLVSAPIFDGPWKNIPVILCYSRGRIPSTLQTLLAKTPLTEANSIPIEEFNKNYNITVLKQPYYIKNSDTHQTASAGSQPDCFFISDNRYISTVTRQAVSAVMQKKIFLI